MENIYIFIVGLLFILAIFDLVVGVSNDAVNFLNSAIGSNAAKWRTIMIIASVGIILGAATSGGMMEVARKGIFNPQHFYFNEIMVLFLAVMITDIILLDLFNTFGMPTSTTVSIVFEILGASFALSVIKVIQGDLPMNFLFNHNDVEAGITGFMNWAKAGEIITGILLSVVFAFSIGALVQFVARFFFSFRYQNKLKFLGSIFGGIAFSLIFYFLLIKGFSGIIKGVKVEDMNAFQSLVYSFLDLTGANDIAAHNKANPDDRILINSQMGIFIAICAGIFSLILFILQSFKVNPLRMVVLFGTFALAMAFAGNDLVNFIGVPIAGWQSFQIWSESGTNPDNLLMTALAGKVATPYAMLIGAGIIMTVTLWLSKKARSVTETEVKLGAQSEIDERFKPNLVARAIVNGSSSVNKGLVKVMPESLIDKINKRFSPVDVTENEAAAAHFDLLRASINLTVASILIAIASSMKLPLSTTYVSFMVAMGTSLADRAWGRESAVYRIAGVMSVVGGWFLTAIIASSVAALFATIMYFGGIYAIIALTLLVAFAIYKTSRHHASKLEKEALSKSKTAINYKDVNETLGFLSTNVETALGDIKRTLELTHLGIAKEDKKALHEANNKLKGLNTEYSMMKNGLFKIIKKNKSDETTSAHLYVLTYDLMQDILQSLTLIVDASTVHVSNNHKPLAAEQCAHLDKVKEILSDYLSYLKNLVNSGDFSDGTIQELLVRKNNLHREIDAATSEQIRGVMDRKYGFKNTSLYFTLLLEIKDLAAVAARFAKLYRRIYQDGKLTK